MNDIYTVVMIQVLGGTRYVMGTKTMSVSELDSLVLGGATVLYKEPKHPRLITVLMN